MAILCLSSHIRLIDSRISEIYLRKFIISFIHQKIVRKPTDLNLDKLINFYNQKSLYDFLRINLKKEKMEKFQKQQQH